MKGFDVGITTAEQLRAARGMDDTIARYYIDLRLARDEEAADELSATAEEKRFLALPYMIRQEQGTPDMDDLATAADGALPVSFSGFLTRNLETLAFLTEKDDDRKIVLDYGVYIWNADAYLTLNAPDAANGRIREYCAPFELSERQWRQTAERMPDVPVGVCVYGRAPMMVSAECAKQTLDGCSGRRGKDTVLTVSLRDRTGRILPVTCDCRYCYNVIWNAHATSLHRDVRRLAQEIKQARLRIDFTTETHEETTAVLRFFLSVMEGETETGAPPYAAYTTGRAQKGVE